MTSVFAIAAPQLVFGNHALSEVGLRARAAGISHAALVTDAHLAQGPWVDTVRISLKSAGLAVSEIADLAVEPTDQSFLQAARDLGATGADGVISVGGGSVIDTAKAANLYSCAPAELLAYVNAPIGQAKEPDTPLWPHIACPTTCGTGSECTGIAIFDYLPMQTKTGIMSRRLIPDLAIVDPEVTRSLPVSVLVATALDAMSHALEAYTCKPFSARGLSADPNARPLTQGANPWSDAIAEIAIRTIACNIRPALDEHAGGSRAEVAARGQLLWAAALAGNAFGNAGCHLPHALSYPISGMVRDYRPHDWPPGAPLIPHGLSVMLTAPACYRLTAPGAIERHRQIAQWLDLPIQDPGDAIASWVETLMAENGLPTRLSHIGYTEVDIPALVEGAVPQRRLLDNAPIQLGADDLKALFQTAL